MTDYNDGKWHGWNGGHCPLHPETRIDWVNGQGKRAVSKSKDLLWHHPDNSKWSMVAFRVIEERKDPREYWIVAKAAGLDPEVWTEKPNFTNWYGERVVHVREVIQ